MSSITSRIRQWLCCGPDVPVTMTRVSVAIYRPPFPESEKHWAVWLESSLHGDTIFQITTVQGMYTLQYPIRSRPDRSTLLEELIFCGEVSDAKYSKLYKTIEATPVRNNDPNWPNWNCQDWAMQAVKRSVKPRLLHLQEGASDLLVSKLTQSRGLQRDPNAASAWLAELASEIPEDV